MKMRLLGFGKRWFGLTVLVHVFFLSGVAVAAVDPNAVYGVAGQEPGASSGQVVQLTLKRLGIQQPLRLVGADVQSTVDFSFHALDIVEKLRLKMHYAYSPTLNSDTSSLHVLLNGQEVGVLPLHRDAAKDAVSVIEIDPLLLQEWNHLTFHLVAHVESPLCDDPRSPQIWIQMDQRDTMIEANTVTLPLSNDLALFPLPFFDKHDARDLTLPFVLPERPSWNVLKSAGILASWFGSLADWRKVHFPSHLNELPDGNAIVLATSDDHIDGLELPPVTDGVGTVAIVDNPRNPDARLLLVVGRDDKNLAATVQALVLGQVSLVGSSQSVQSVSLAKRKPFDAPLWLSGEKKVRVGDLVPPEQLVATGLFVTPHTMVLKLPPNLLRSDSTSIPFDFSFSASNNERYLVRLDASINGMVFQSVAFTQTQWGTSPMAKGRVRFDIPTRSLTGRDTISVKFTFADKAHAICNTAFVKDEIHIDPGSTVDFTKVPRYTELPDLSYLAYTGYPFSKMADLSETTVMLPEKPDRHEIESMLVVLGHIGNKTGYPATGVSIAGIKDAEKNVDKDILIVGVAERLRPILDDWKRDIPVNLLSDGQPFPSWGSRYLQRWEHWPELSAKIKSGTAKRGMILTGFESPLQSERSVVIISAANSSSLPEEASVLNTANAAKDFIGDVAVVSDKDTYDRVDAFELAPKFAIGDLPPILRFWKFVEHNPLLAGLIAYVIGVFFASMAYRKLLRRSREKLNGGAA